MSLSENEIKFKNIQKMREYLKVSTNVLTAPRTVRILTKAHRYDSVFCRPVSVVMFKRHLLYQFSKPGRTNYTIFVSKISELLLL